MRHALLTLLLMFAASPLVAGELTRQDQYDESVGYAYGRTLIPVATGRRCMELFPEYADTISHGLQRWRERNSEALAEVEAQWRAYVDRDHKAAQLPARLYDQQTAKVISEQVANAFTTLGGEDSIPAQQFCKDYASATLRSTKIYLEALLMTQLESFRNCGREGLCPNISRPGK
ncbi:hypothetical protein [Roseateles sp. P5_D6]